MPTEIQLPRLGWSMEEGTFLDWLKKEGDFVREGEPLFVVEGDKAAQEVEAIATGTLGLAPDAPKAGEAVRVGRVLGWLLAEGEAPPAVGAAPGARPKNTAAPAASGPPLPRPREATADSSPRINTPASPRARRVARERGVDLRTLQPSGAGGRIRERDVLAAATSQTPVQSAGALVGSREVPLTALRRAIASRMANSRRNSVPVTLTCRCDATQLIARRRQFKSAAAAGIVPGITDIIVKLTGAALRLHPLLAGRWDGDRILIPDTIHVGIAVDTDAGLLVPVIRNVATSTLEEIAGQSQRLVAAARSSQLAAADLQGACFTLTNLGRFGIEAFTPVINPPETAILGVGAILREAVALPDGTLTCREQMTLSLTFDHRVIDGAPAARFLQAVRQGIENLTPGLD